MCTTLLSPDDESTYNYKGAKNVDYEDYNMICEHSAVVVHYTGMWCKLKILDGIYITFIIISKN